MVARSWAKEEEFTRLRDQLSRERRELPWERVEKEYTFGSQRGTLSLGNLFEGRGQLVCHAMFNRPKVSGSVMVTDATRRTRSRFAAERDE